MARTLTMTAEEFRAGAAYEASEKGRTYAVIMELNFLKENEKHKSENQKEFEEAFNSHSNEDQREIIFMRNGGFDEDSIANLQTSKQYRTERLGSMGRYNSNYIDLTGDSYPDCEKAMLLEFNGINFIDRRIKQRLGEQ